MNIGCQETSNKNFFFDILSSVISLIPSFYHKFLKNKNLVTKLFTSFFLIVFLSGCEPGCVESNEFDNEFVRIDSYPIADGVEGLGDNQTAKWHDTGLKTNGEAISLQITGSWTPWYGNDDLSGLVQLNQLPVCSFCAMKENSTNCLCFADGSYNTTFDEKIKVPTSERYYTNSDCLTNIAAQNDNSKCSCTRQQGNADDYGVYHFPLGFYDKNHVVLNPDNQEVCRYTAGMGLYLGVFGSNGSQIPIRAYHLFSQTEVCDIVRNNDGKCIDESGIDRTKYIFNSANNKIFVKDDFNGNDSIDPNPSDDSLHSANEKIKMIILDSRYDDNYGEYQVTFLSGTGSEEEKGLLEFFVRLIEDEVLGEIGTDGNRNGGIIQGMFNNIVLDSGFITIVQMALSFYILFYGFATLIGVAEISKKEIMKRVVKIALVIFFTSETSWYWYNELVVKFFKDGMDYVLSILMSLSDQNIDPTSGIITAQMERAASNSNATRFSYADLIIKNLLSTAVAKKTFGLFFGEPLFGLVYILAIYALIAFFLYVMLNVAMNYVLAVMKMAFALSLGPIFIAFTLSNQTEGMFKKWLSFVASRSLEIIILFLVLYNFLTLIDQRFTTILNYRACLEQFNLGLFSIPVLISEVDRSLIEWFSLFIELAALILIMMLTIEKLPDLAGSLITIGGQSSGGYGGGSSFLGGAIGAAKAAGGFAFSASALVAAKTFQGVAPIVSRAASYAGSNALSVAKNIPGVSSAISAVNRVSSMLPSNPRAMMRNSMIDSSIKKATADATSKGLTGTKKDEYIRSAVVKSLTNQNIAGDITIGNAPRNSIAVGLDYDRIAARLDEKLIAKPLAEFIKAKSAEMKADTKNPLIGKEFRDQLHKEIQSWATKNIAGGYDAVKPFLENKDKVVEGVSLKGVSFNNMAEFIRSQSEYSAAEAAKAFADKPEKQQQYLQHLKDNQFRLQNARDKASTLGKVAYQAYDFTIGKAAKTLKPLDNFFGNDALSDPNRAAASFIRKVDNANASQNTTSEEIRKATGGWLKHNQGSVLNPLNLLKSKAAIRQELKEGDRAGLTRYLSKNGAEKEQRAIKKDYEEKIKAAPNHQARKLLEKKRDEKLAKSKDRREFFKKELKDNAIKTSTKSAQEISESLKKINELQSRTWDKFGRQVDNKVALTTNQLEKAKLEKELKNNQKKSEQIAKDLASLKQKEELAKKSALSTEERNKLEQDIRNKEIEQKRNESDKKKTQEELNNKREIIEKLAQENDRLQKEKLKEMAEIAIERVKVKSVAEVVEDIEKLRKNSSQSIQGSIKDDGSDKKIMNGEMADLLEKELFSTVQREFDEALKKHLEKQKELISLDDKTKAEIESKTLAEQREILSKELSKLFPDDEEKLNQAIDNLNQTGKDYIESVGGVAALKEGLTEIDSTTLFEKEARLKYLEEKFPSGSGKTTISSDNPLESSVVISRENSENTISISDINVSIESTSSTAIDSTAIDRSFSSSNLAKIENRDLFSEEGKIRKSEDFTSIASLSSDASLEEAEKAFKKLRFKYHPDRVQNFERKSEATEIFQELTNSFDKFKSKKPTSSTETSSSPEKPQPSESLLQIQDGNPSLEKVVNEMDNKTLSEVISETAVEIEKNKQNKSDLEADLVDLEILKAHPSLAPYLSENDKKDGKKPQDPDNNQDKENLRNLLNLQSNILNAQITAIKEKIEASLKELEDLKVRLTLVGGNQLGIENQIKQSESMIKGLTGEENNLRAALDKVANELNSLG
jgi:type IV secretory pathway VirB6-like protein